VADESPLTLANGHRLRIRALQLGEIHRVRELCAQLSLRTRYLRFFSPMTVLPESLLQTLADVDDVRRLTLIAELDDPGGGDVVALGNLVVIDDDRAEVGLVVADAWQRQGIGVSVAARLLDAAERRGIRRFVVHGLWDNPAFRPLLNYTATVVSATMRFGVSEVSFVRRRSTATSPKALKGATVGHAPDPNPAREQAYQRILFSGGRAGDDDNGT
jgi:GNAT superfamily N-acetyltransferase